MGMSCNVVVIIAELLPLLMSVPSPDDCLHYVDRELKTGLAKENYLMLREKYKEITRKSNKTTDLERQA